MKRCVPCVFAHTDGDSGFIQYIVQGALSAINMLREAMKLKTFSSFPVPALEPNFALKKKNVPFVQLLIISVYVWSVWNCYKLLPLDYLMSVLHEKIFLRPWTRISTKILWI